MKMVLISIGAVLIAVALIAMAQLMGFLPVTVPEMTQRKMVTLVVVTVLCLVTGVLMIAGVLMHSATWKAAGGRVGTAPLLYLADRS